MKNFIFLVMIGLAATACDDSTERVRDSNQSTSDTAINSSPIDGGATQGGGGVGTGSGLATDSSPSANDSTQMNSSPPR